MLECLIEIEGFRNCPESTCYVNTVDPDQLASEEAI